MPELSVIICTHNRVILHENALKSLLKQEIDPTCFEIIVVDNASLDGKQKLISAYAENTLAPEIRYVHEEHIGISWARNAGWRAARGKYFAYINDDETANPNRLHLLVTTLEERPQPFAVIGGPIFLAVLSILTNRLGAKRGFATTEYQHW